MKDIPKLDPDEWVKEAPGRDKVLAEYKKLLAQAR